MDSGGGHYNVCSMCNLQMATSIQPCFLATSWSCDESSSYLMALKLRMICLANQMHFCNHVTGFVQSDSQHFCNLYSHGIGLYPMVCVGGALVK